RMSFLCVGCVRRTPATVLLPYTTLFRSRVTRGYETVPEAGSSVPSTSFAAGDLVRVTLTITVPQERRYVAVSDPLPAGLEPVDGDRKSTRLNSSHVKISYAVFCLKKKND